MESQLEKNMTKRNGHYCLGSNAQGVLPKKMQNEMEATI